jgi:anti-sigma factor RsiW
MIPCRLVKTLASFIPFPALRESVSLRHAERCPACQEKLLSKGEAKSRIFGAEDVEDDPHFWPAVRERIRRMEAAKAPRPSLISPRVQKWAAVTGLALLAAAGLLIVRTHGPLTIPRDKEGPTRFRLNYLKVDSKAIEPVIVQPRDADLVIIWVDGTR